VIRQQAALVDLPLVEIELPWPCGDELYGFAVGQALAGLQRREGIDGVAYGDIFLADVRRFRERLLAPIGLTATFPLWGIRTDLLAQRLLRAGVEARIVAVDPTRVDRQLAGATWDAGLVRRLPPEVDPCGERGEFHTLVTAGPMFTAPLVVYPDEISDHDGIVWADLSLRRPIDG
jgi:diphthamide synthase (EF-2-diphthine--ammonia ligase)